MPIKVYRSEHAGAPTLHGQAGSLLAVLDACLVTGYGDFAVTSITRSGSTATCTCNAGHNLATKDIALITGATQPEYNGEFQVTVLTPTQFTFQVTGSPATPATGSPAGKRASANFTVPFAGTNIKVYRSSDLTGRRHYYKVIDDGSVASSASNGQVAAVQGYEKMTSLTEGEGSYPGDAPQIALRRGLYWLKSYQANSTARPWTIVTDGKTVYAILGQMLDVTSSWSLNIGYMTVGAFGDTDNPHDPYGCFVSGSDSNSITWNVARNGGLTRNAGTTAPSPGSLSASIAVARSSTYSRVSAQGMDQPYSYGTGILGHGLQHSAIGQAQFLNYPTPNGKVVVAPLAIFTLSGPVFRGFVPGLYEPYHGWSFANHYDIFEDEGGRQLMFLQAGDSGNGSAFMIDITGPWS